LDEARAHAAEERDDEERPAWSLAAADVARIGISVEPPAQVDREWALAGATGRGAKVCILDSGVDADHPRVGGLAGAVAVSLDDDGNAVVSEDDEGDVCGHGTACAGIIRALAPEVEIYSARVLGAGFTGSGPVLVAGLRWAVEQDFDIVNMSLSTTKRQFIDALHDVTDAAYFNRTIVVASAHNMPVESYPWRFSSVISVGSHEESDPLVFYANPEPPVEFFARGVDVEVAWMGGSMIRATGNSFATPSIAGICALVLSKHPQLTPYQVKTVLYLIASNVGGAT
jgi:subtilisin family serine protease